MMRVAPLLLLVAFHSHLLALYAHSTVDNRRVVVVGGGAAGYFSALQCKRVCTDNAEVMILEAGEALAKVAISGGGRCNVMHDPHKSPLVISKGYPRGSKELVGPLTTMFGPWDAYDWFTSRGVLLKTEEDGRVFPSTDKSQTIIDVLTNEADSLGVVVSKGARVTSVKKRQQQGSEEATGFVVEYVQEDTVKVLNADKVIFATGGARPGHKMMKELGHSLEEPLPSLFSFKVSDEKLLALAGTSSRNARVKLLVSKDMAKEHKALLRPQMIPLLTQQGPILITHQGLSGPAVLRLSAYGAKIFHKLQYSFSVQVNWLRFTEKATIAMHLKNEKERHPQRLVGKGFPVVPLNLLMRGEDDDEEAGATTNGSSSNRDFAKDEDHEGEEEAGSLTRRLWHYLLAKADTELATSTPIGTLKWAEVTNKMLDKIASLVSECEFQVTGRGQYRDEFVTCGGVSLKDIAIDSMASKKVQGLYLCGEVVDVDGITGGFNFMSAWCTGYVAGNACGSSLV